MELDQIESVNPAPQPEKKSKGKGCLIAVGLFLGIAVLIGVCTPDPISEQTTFADAADKQEWLLDHQEVTSGTELSLQLADEIRRQFKFPDEVEFPNGDYGIVKVASLLDVNTGLWQSIGRVKAKNAFGVVGSYQYDARFIRTDAAESVISVEIREGY